ncbi:MAG TPA: GFA family protein [Devosia sp.]|uniref:GFA family protein n=1 Tax=Devosia sp. TaxID=1871048 RepID=UPI002F93A482
MALPKFPVEGGCVCGQVRYRLKALPLSVYNCHCKDCQRFSGAAWSMSMIVRDEDFELLSGQLEQYRRTADSGNIITMNFCANCHGWIWNDPPTPGIKVARAGTLDDMHWARPVGNIWVDSKAEWADIDPGLVNFGKGIADRTPLFDAWTRAQGTRS